MALNYAEQWSPELLEILMQGTLTSPFVTSNVKWLDAKTFHFTQMSVSGYKNHARNGGWNRGNYAQTGGTGDGCTVFLKGGKESAGDGWISFIHGDICVYQGEGLWHA